jgi:hydrogenase nickel incorporation protein HypB
MCRDCGCSKGVGRVHAHDHQHEHHDRHYHQHEPQHVHDGPDDRGRFVPVHRAILSKNDRLAERNRGDFEARGLLVLNVLSSPGSGKTALLQRTLADLGGRLRAGVIVGDLATDNDARRIRSAGVPAVQITTGSVCHLDAEMVARAAETLDLDALDLLIIENVGNLVCPASYDLGETVRVVLLSVTEGEDKPLKYPAAFQSAQVVVLSKMDMAEAAGFDRETALANIRRVAPHAKIFEVSARTGSGMEHWYAHLESGLRHRQHA